MFKTIVLFVFLISSINIEIYAETIKSIETPHGLITFDDDINSVISKLGKPNRKITSSVRNRSNLSMPETTYYYMIENIEYIIRFLGSHIYHIDKNEKI